LQRYHQEPQAIFTTQSGTINTMPNGPGATSTNIWQSGWYDVDSGPHDGDYRCVRIKPPPEGQ
jgi:hypothetical protein